MTYTHEASYGLESMHGLPEVEFLVGEGHFPMPLIDQMLDHLVGQGWYCFYMIL